MSWPFQNMSRLAVQITCHMCLCHASQWLHKVEADLLSQICFQISQFSTKFHKLYLILKLTTSVNHSTRSPKCLYVPVGAHKGQKHPFQVPTTCHRPVFTFLGKTQNQKQQNTVITTWLLTKNKKENLTSLVSSQQKPHTEPQSLVSQPSASEPLDTPGILLSLKILA